MKKPDSRILFFALTLLAIGLFYSCDDAFLDQPDNVLVPANKTTMFLSAERLPTPPAGMIYELWVVPASGTAKSLGRFSFIDSDTLIAFLDTTGTIRADSNMFVLDGDLFSYTYLSVTIEEDSTTEGLTMGPVMLTDKIVQLEDFHPKLNFPESEDLHRAIAFYNFEAVSDNDRSINDGSGVWFCNYRVAFDHINDTTWAEFDTIEVDVVPEIPIDTIIDTVIDSSNPVWDTTITTVYDTSTDTTNVDSLHGPFPVGVDTFSVDSTRLMYGPDTLILRPDSFLHIGMTIKLNYARDDTYPFTKTQIEPTYSVDSGLSRDVIYDIFTQDEYGLPDYSALGWKWEGWVVSQNIQDTIPNRFTGPAWPHNTPQKNWFPGSDGQMVSTGTFSKIDTVDDADPFTFSLYAGMRVLYDSSSWDPITETGPIDTIYDTLYQRPRYAGEDFLDTAAMDSAWGTGTDYIELIEPSGDYGSVPTTVFISLVPNNFRSDTTNFPLIALAAHYIGERSTLMDNLTGTVEGNIGRGFPEIKISYIRE